MSYTATIRFLTGTLLSLVLFAAHPDIYAQRDLAERDSLLELRKELTGSERALLDGQLVHQYVPYDLDSARYFLQQMQDQLQKNYTKEVDAYFNKYRSTILSKEGNYKESIPFRIKAYELFRELKNYNEIGWNARGLGISYFQLGDYASAMDYFLVALAAFEKNKDFLGMGDIHNNLGAVSYVSGHPREALEYYNRALELYREVNEDKRRGRILNNTGLIYFDRGNFEKALSQFIDALKIYREYGENDKLGGVFNNIGLCYHHLDQVNLASSYMHRALEHALDIGDTYNEISAYINLGAFNITERHYDSAANYLHKAGQMAKERDLRALYVNVLEEKSNLEAEQKNYKKALSLYRIYHDSIHNLHSEAADERIANLMASHEQQVKENEIRQLKEERTTQKLVNRLFVMVIVVILFVLGLVIYNVRNKKRTNQLLADKNFQLTEMNKKLTESEKALKALNESKDRLFSIVAHDLRNPVAAVSGFSELLYDNYEKLDEASRKEYLLQIMQGADRSQGLLENLLLWARSQMKSIACHPVLLDVKTLIEESIKPLKGSIEHKRIKVTIQVTESLHINADREMLKAVIRNLVTNAIKFSFPGETIQIKTRGEKSACCIDVTDHGIGMQPEVRESLFDENKKSTTPGTSGESGSGLGLILCKEFTEKNGGTITVNSSPGTGSTFTICFPLAN